MDAILEAIVEEGDTLAPTNEVEAEAEEERAQAVQEEEVMPPQQTGEAALQALGTEGDVAQGEARSSRW